MHLGKTPRANLASSVSGKRLWRCPPNCGTHARTWLASRRMPPADRCTTCVVVPRRHGSLVGRSRAQRAVTHIGPDVTVVSSRAQPCCEGGTWAITHWPQAGVHLHNGRSEVGRVRHRPAFPRWLELASMSVMRRRNAAEDENPWARRGGQNDDVGVTNAGHRGIAAKRCCETANALRP